SDFGPLRPGIVRRGPEAVAQGATTFAGIAEAVEPVLVNGAAGAVAIVGGQVISLAAFTVVGGKVVALDILADPDRLNGLDLSFLG
ncbi:RNA polymerase subunit sigma-70, partial [Saccharopolyspora sp. NPDC002686]